MSKTKRREPKGKENTSERAQLQKKIKFDKRGKRQRTRRSEAEAYREEFTD
jgi:hypothetical protein